MGSPRLSGGRAALGTAAALLLSSGLVACGASTQETIARNAAKGAVLGTYEGVRALPTAPIVAGLVEDPSIRKAAHDVIESMVLGARDGADQVAIDRRVQALVATILVTAGEKGDAALGQILEDQGPRLSAVVHDTLTRSLSDAGIVFRNQSETNLSEATRALVKAAVGSFAEAVRGEDGAAAALGLSSEKIAEGAVRGLRNELGSEETAAVVSALAKRAVRDADAEIGASRTLWIVISVVGLTLLAIAGAALALILRRYTLASRTLSLVAASINQAEHKGLKQSIKAKAENAKLQAFLSGFLHDRGL
jgi:hypothetical protein